MTDSTPSIVVLGGGTGSFTLLQKLKEYTSHLTAIVNMSDDGGSTGTLRDELGVLPPGDARQCLVALSDSPEIRNLFSYRFSEGPVSGHTVGNLILSALEIQYGSFQKAVEVASDILRISGRVLPVTFDNHTLVVTDGAIVHRGEHIIDGPLALSKSAKVSLDPPAVLNPEALAAILSANIIVIAPGSFHGSLLPVLAVDGMSNALQKTKGRVVCVTNLVNKPLQTDNWHVVDYVEQFERYIGKGQIDTVLYNTEPISLALIKKYAADGEFPVVTTAKRFKETPVNAIGARLVSKEISAQDSADVLRRTLIRHDADQVCKELMRIFYQ
jgi:uncharacterized cofD-like protein